MIHGRQSGHLAPGSAFPEGRTTVTYIATDLTGNSQLCDIIVTVEGKVWYFIISALYTHCRQFRGHNNWKLKNKNI